jgi:hypothetical protein
MPPLLFILNLFFIESKDGVTQLYENIEVNLHVSQQ